jgi:Complex 1 protein (LYR family)
MRCSRPLSILRPFITPTHDSKIPFYDAQLANYLHQHPEELRSRVLRLYRSIVRTVAQTPPSKARDDAFIYARNEFRRNLPEKDVLKAYYLAQQGETEWKMLRRYFDDMRVFDRRNIQQVKYQPQKIDREEAKRQIAKVDEQGPSMLPGWKVRYTNLAEKKAWKRSDKQR